MPSPFPGMDPFIESQRWEPFHASLMIDVADALSDRLPERYIVEPQKRIYIEYPSGESHQVVPDGAVLDVGDGSSTSSTAVVDAVEVELLMPVERHETYLEVRDLEEGRVVTVIEVLSPANKRAGSGAVVYREKLDDVLRSGLHFVEIDLLRGGTRQSTSFTRGDYLALVSRAERRPRADAFAWSIRDPLPTIPVPLLGRDERVDLELQAVFTARYDRTHYARVLDYDKPLSPAPSESDATWIAEQIREWRAAR